MKNGIQVRSGMPISRGESPKSTILASFGREGIFSASYWPLFANADHPNSYSMGAFACYINYYETGARVGDLSAQSLTSDHVRTSVYAMRSSTQTDRMWIVSINKTAEQIPLTLSLTLTDSPAAFNLWRVFCLQAGSPDPQHVADYSMDGTNIGYLMPAYSVTTIEFSTQGGGVPPPPLPGDNHPPVLTLIGNQTVQAGQTIQFTLQATDPDPGSVLQFAATGTN